MSSSGGASEEPSMWEAVLAGSSGQIDTGAADAVTTTSTSAPGGSSVRFIFVGGFRVGKRSLAGRLREALSNPIDASAPPTGPSVQRATTGAGFDHQFTELRRADGSTRVTIELICIDSPLYLRFALPTAAIAAKSTVVVAVDVSDAKSSEADVAHWLEAINNHVAALPGADTSKLAAMVTKRSLSALATPGAGTEAAETSQPCLVPCIVALTKADFADRLFRPYDEASMAVTAGKLTAGNAFQQLMRQVAMTRGVSLAVTSTRAAGAATAAFERILARYCLHVCGIDERNSDDSSYGGSASPARSATMSSSRSESADAMPLAAALTELVSSSTKLAPNCFVPAFSDVPASLLPQIRTRLVTVQSIFGSSKSTLAEDAAASSTTTATSGTAASSAAGSGASLSHAAVIAAVEQLAASAADDFWDNLDDEA